MIGGRGVELFMVRWGQPLADQCWPYSNIPRTVVRPLDSLTQLEKQDNGLQVQIRRLATGYIYMWMIIGQSSGNYALLGWNTGQLLYEDTVYLYYRTMYLLLLC